MQRDWLFVHADYLVQLGRRVSHTSRVRLPSSRCPRHRVRRYTTFFPRHGFRSWLWRRIRIVSRPTLGTSFRLTASSAIRRGVQRARPSGGSTANHGDNPLLVCRLENLGRPRPLLLVQSSLQSAFQIPMPDHPNRLWGEFL